MHKIDNQGKEKSGAYQDQENNEKTNKGAMFALFYEGYHCLLLLLFVDEHSRVVFEWTIVVIPSSTGIVE
jgi:hypothetical protein